VLAVDLFGRDPGLPGRVLRLDTIKALSLSVLPYVFWVLLIPYLIDHRFGDIIPGLQGYLAQNVLPSGTLH